MSVIKHKNQRVAILFDVQNLYHSAKNLYGARVNFTNILKAATAGRQLIRAIGYVIATESGEEKGFFDALTKIGIELKVKDLQVFPGGMKKADWDVGLAVDAIRLANLVDAVVIVSGDGDYIPLLEYIRQALGVQVEVMAFGRSASGKLKEMCDDFTDLGAEPEKYTIRISRSALMPRSRRAGGYSKILSNDNNNEKIINPTGE
ncbi:MAG: NYN domain-containing protein [Candidatus Sungbacteria bacterium]|nr:NYN domain-containing protein [Candidatus Sungbacteria bacterium]